MDIIGSIVLILILLLAINQMAGGRPNNILGPAGRICSRLVGMAFAITGRMFGAVLGLLGSSVKSIPTRKADEHKGGSSEKPPPRW